MKNKKDDRQGFGELAESIYFLVLPLLCIASLMRGCGAKSARIPETEQQTVSEQQHVTEESGETDPAGKYQIPADGDTYHKTYDDIYDA